MGLVNQNKMPALQTGSFAYGLNEPESFKIE